MEPELSSVPFFALLSHCAYTITFHEPYIFEAFSVIFFCKFCLLIFVNILSVKFLTKFFFSMNIFRVYPEVLFKSSLIRYCYVVSSSYLLIHWNLFPSWSHCFRNYCRQTARHMQSTTDAPEMIPYQNLLMMNQTVVIASGAASVAWCFIFCPFIYLIYLHFLQCQNYCNS